MRTDLLTTLVLTSLEIVGYWLFLCASTLCGHAERIWTWSALSLYHFFLLLGVVRFKITIQRRFWRSRTEIHELLNPWFFSAQIKTALDMLVLCLALLYMSGLPWKLIPNQASTQTLPFKKEHSFIHWFSIGMYCCWCNTLTKSALVYNSLKYEGYQLDCLDLQNSAWLNILPLL